MAFIGHKRWGGADLEDGFAYQPRQRQRVNYRNGRNDRGIQLQCRNDRHGRIERHMGNQHAIATARIRGTYAKINGGTMNGGSSRCDTTAMMRAFGAPTIPLHGPWHLAMPRIGHPDRAAKMRESLAAMERQWI